MCSVSHSDGCVIYGLSVAVFVMYVVLVPYEGH